MIYPLVVVSALDFFRRSFALIGTLPPPLLFKSAVFAFRFSPLLFMIGRSKSNAGYNRRETNPTIDWNKNNDSVRYTEIVERYCIYNIAEQVCRTTYLVCFWVHFFPHFLFTVLRLWTPLWADGWTKPFKNVHNRRWCVMCCCLLFFPSFSQPPPTSPLTSR